MAALLNEIALAHGQCKRMTAVSLEKQEAGSRFSGILHVSVDSLPFCLFILDSECAGGTFYNFPLRVKRYHAARQVKYLRA